MDPGRLVTRLYERPAEPEAVATLKGDASSRRYHRIFMGEGFDPPTLIAMELPEDASRSDEAVSGPRGAPEELPFLNVGRHLAAAGLRVPAVLLDAVGEGFLLLEDLGDDTLVRRLEGAGEEEVRAWYGAAVDLLVEVHRRMWPVPEGCQAAKRSFDFDLLRWELDHYREWGAEALLGGALDPGARRALDGAFDDLAAEVAALPRGFVHRDYQSRNLMVVGAEPAPESLAIIDFQDALEGPRAYDLVALLNDSYMDLSGDLKDDLSARYAHRAGIDPEGLRREVDLVTVQRKLKDGGRFVFIDRVKGNPSFLPFVDASFERVRRALGRLPGHERLASALAATDPGRFG